MIKNLCEWGRVRCPQDAHLTIPAQITKAFITFNPGLVGPAARSRTPRPLILPVARGSGKSQ